MSMTRQPKRATQARQSWRGRERRTAFGRTAWSEEPDRAIEERGIGIFSAADLFACHGVAGEESRLAGRVVFVTGTGTHCAFDAADVGDKLVFAEERGEAVEPFEDGEDGTAEEDDVCFRSSGEWIVG